MTDEHRPTIQCPKCLDAGRGQQIMVVRTNEKNGSEFLGCPQYPKCRHSQPLPIWFEMERMGAERLPGW